MSLTISPVRYFHRLSLAIKVPLIVAFLMLFVSAAVTLQVFSRLVDNQERNLSDLAEAYLDGLSSSLIPHVQREDNWEIFDNLERSRVLYRGLRVKTAIVIRPDRTVLASTDPSRFQTEMVLPELQPNARTRVQSVGAMTINLAPESWLGRDLVFQERPIGTILAEIDMSHLRAERKDVFTTLVATNLTLTMIFVALGWWLVRRMLAPIQKLSRQMASGAQGPLTLFPPETIGDSHSEFGRVFLRYNAMAQAVQEREILKERLAEEERLASLGRLSTIIAHEINNPLGGLLNAVDTIKHHGEASSVRRVAIGLLERGLNNIREVVGMTLAIYRPDRNPRPLRASDVDDLRLLVEGAATRRSVRLVWRNRISTACTAPSGPIRQIILNLVINAIQAVPPDGTVMLEASNGPHGTCLVIEDDGPGLPGQMRAVLEAAVPPPAPHPNNGIGIWMVSRLIADLGGRLLVVDGRATGTRIEISLPERPSGEIRHVA